MEVTFVVSNPDPLVDSTVTATATVTNNGAAVPNGTAVEFIATGGSFGAEGQSIVKTTTNGVASIAVTSSVAGPVVVRAIVNNVVRTATVTFRAKPIVTPPVGTTPTISSVSPAIGRPGGGETVTITGTNFRAPVRVLFAVDGGTPQEVFVVSVTSTKIEVLSPGVNIPTGGQAVADVIVITEAGSTNEQRVQAGDVFTFRGTVLTPRIATITPNSGPVTGNTRVSIIGDGFQAPVQVLFGTAEARVIDVEYAEIIVETPAARDTSADGSGLILGPVPVVVRNINSQLSATSAEPFNYKSAVDVIAAGPTQGPATGGTQIEITGHGFVGQVAVTVAGVAAQPIFVSGTKIIAITGAVDVEGCADVSGPITVTNLANGDQDDGPEYTYDVLEPAIVGVTPAVPGGVISVSVVNAEGLSRLSLGDQSLIITGSSTTGNITTFTATVPVNVELATESCGIGSVVRQIPTSFDVVYKSLETDCEDTLTNGVTISPTPNDPRLVVTPGTFTPFQATITPASAGPPPTVATVTPSEPQTVTLVNAGTGTLTISSVTPVGAGCASFQIIDPGTPAGLASCEQFPITVTYQGTTTPGSHQCTVSVVTSEGTRNFSLLGTSQ